MWADSFPRNVISGCSFLFKAFIKRGLQIKWTLSVSDNQKKRYEIISSAMRLKSNLFLATSGRACQWNSVAWLEQLDEFFEASLIPCIFIESIIFMYNH